MRLQMQFIDFSYCLLGLFAQRRRSVRSTEKRIDYKNWSYKSVNDNRKVNLRNLSPENCFGCLFSMVSELAA